MRSIENNFSPIEEQLPPNSSVTIQGTDWSDAQIISFSRFGTEFSVDLSENRGFERTEGNFLALGSLGLLSAQIAKVTESPVLTTRWDVGTRLQCHGTLAAIVRQGFAAGVLNDEILTKRRYNIDAILGLE